MFGFFLFLFDSYLFSGLIYIYIYITMFYYLSFGKNLESKFCVVSQPQAYLFGGLFVLYEVFQLAKAMPSR